jgi:DNA-binding XRE family transcriptional regulator
VSPYVSFAFVAYVFCTWYVVCVSSAGEQIRKPDIGARIREARDGIGLSQVQFAKALKLAERTVQAWEGNDRTPRLDALLKVAEKTGRPVAFFYGDGSEQVEEKRAA